MCAKTSFVCIQMGIYCAIIAGWQKTSPKDDNDLLTRGDTITDVLRTLC
ncbi:conserved hypothetical protein [Escherichia coli IAI1]|nr:conserved hypothetical protein [Escherichia coli IAI1]